MVVVGFMYVGSEQRPSGTIHDQPTCTHMVVISDRLDTLEPAGAAGKRILRKYHILPALNRR